MADRDLRLSARAGEAWRKTRAGIVLALVVASLTVAPNAAQGQLSGIGVSNVPLFPSNVTVGDQNQPAALVITNQSFGAPIANQPVTITNIRLNPNCNTSSAPGTLCPQPEPRPNPALPVLDIEPPGVVTTDPIGPVATGRAGTACAGTVFTVSPPDASGTVTFTPSTPIVLGPATTGGPAAECIIDFTFDVIQRPLDGNTQAVSFVDAATAPLPGQPGQVQTLPNVPGASQVIVVAEAPTSIVTQAAPQNVTQGASFSDTALVTGVPFGPPLTDSVLFTLYRSAPGNPGFPTCSAAEQVATGIVPVVAGPPAANGAPTATATFTPPVQPPGRYVFVATYDPPGGPNPDINYLSSTTACGDPLEQVTVNPLLPTIAVEKTANPTVVSEPGGPVVFTVRVINTGPNDVTLTSLNDDVYGNLAGRPAPAGFNPCIVAPPGSRPPTPPLLPANGGEFNCAFTGQVPVTGAGVPGTSQRDVVTAVGTDVNGNTATANDDAVVQIVGVPPAVDVVKTANPLTLPEPGGTFTYTVIVTNTSTVEPLTINSLNDSVYGNLFTRPGSTCGPLSGTTLPVAPGPGNTFTCTFTGDFNGPGGSSLTDVVTVVGTDNDGQTATDSDDAVVNITDVAPAVRVVKTANPTSMPAPGGVFTFTAVVSNPSGETITITDLDDNIYGDLATLPGSTCGALINTTLAPGASSAPCTFPGAFNGAAGATQTDVVTVIARDDEGNIVTDDDDATVTLTGAPLIRVDKTADPTTRPEPGGDFTYTVVVTNVGPEPLTITSLNDNVYGNLATRPGSTCGALIGTTLAPGASSAPCTFTAPFTGNANASLTDVVTVVGTSPTGTQVTDTDDATVTLTPVPPIIAVDKTADPLTRPAPGGDFTFRVVVTNTSANEAVTVTTLTDNIYGNLATRPGSTCGALIGTTLAPGASSAPCTFTGPFTGTAGQSQTDIVTATGVDDDGQTATANDDATVTLIGITPAIRVDKQATPLTMPAPGGLFTFNVLVTNTGPNSLTLTSLTDNIYGNIATQGTCTTAIGTVLPSGGTYSCSFQGPFTGLGGASQTDIVTVTGTDANGTVVTDNDDATVTLTNVPPTVRVVKTANPLTRPEPGGEFVYTVVVTNTSAERVRIDSLIDSVYGNLATRAGSTCGALIGTFLAPGASSAPCTFPANFFGNAGASLTDVVTVTVTDDEGTTATDQDDAVVDITDVPPTINVVKDATPASMPAPGGTFTFNVVVTNTSFEPVTITTLTDDIYGNLVGRGNCNVGAVLPPNGGTYSCSFPGEFTGVGGASQTDVVTVTGVDNDGTTVTDTDDATVTLTGGGVLALPVLRVDKTAAPTSRPAPGGTFTFNVVVTNPGTVAVTIRTLTDDVYGDVTRIPGSTCNTAIGTVLAPGGTYTCAFQGDFRGPGNSQTDVVTVTGTDNQGNIARASDDAVVTITPPPPGVPSIATTKVASPGSLPEPGGLFTFTHTVVNNGPEPVRITSLVDNVYGDLNGKGSCTVGARLAVGASYTCSFPGNFFGNAGAAQTDVITTTAVDDRGQTVTSRADAIVRITDVPPTVTVVKSADPVSRPEPGGTFRFTVTVTNTSFEPVTIRSLVDDIYGDLNGRGSCSVGIRLAARGGSYSCAFDGDFRGRSGDSQTDIVTVVAVDDDNTPATDSDRATVTLTPPGTPPVSPPPPPPPAPPAPQAPQRPLVRTGSDLTGPARLAGLLLLVGMTLVAATRRFGEGGPGLVPVPAGPGGGPRRPRGPGSGPRGFGNDSWFGGAPVAPPPGPLGGLGAGVVEAPPAPPAAEPAAEPDSGHGFGNDSWFSGPQAQPPQGPLGGLGSDLVAAPPAPPAAEPNSEPAWDEWVGVRAPAETVASKVDPVEAPTAAAPVAETPVAEMLVAEPVAVEPVAVEPVAFESVAYEPVVDTRVADQAVRAIAGPTGDAATTVAGADGLVPEVVVPTVVQVRSTNALDGAALDAAQALSAPARTAAPPAARRRGRKLGRS